MNENQNWLDQYIDEFTTYEVNINFPPSQMVNLGLTLVVSAAIIFAIYFKMKRG